MANKTDIDKAVKNTRKRAEKLKEWDGWVSDLLDKAIRRMVQDIRHQVDVEIRKAAGKYGGAAQVTISSATSGAAANIFHYMIAGRTLGMVMGSELAGIAEAEAGRANGAMFNAKLCDALRPLVPADKRVQEAVTQAKLQQIFAELTT
jgi:hypothetical protein